MIVHFLRKDSDPAKGAVLVVGLHGQLELLSADEVADPFPYIDRAAVEITDHQARCSAPRHLGAGGYRRLPDVRFEDHVDGWLFAHTSPEWEGKTVDAPAVLQTESFHALQIGTEARHSVQVFVLRNAHEQSPHQLVFR